MNRFIFIPTWRCPFRCPYCDYNIKFEKDYYICNAFQGWKIQKIEREYDDETWLEALRPYEPYRLDITGGEPSIYPYLGKLLKKLPKGCKWAVTTNAMNIKPFFEAKLEANIGFTASYHPYAPKPYSNLGWFRDQLMQLRSIGYFIQVTIVAYPYNLSKLRDYVSFFEQDFAVNVMPFFSRLWDWTEHPELLRKLMEFKQYWHGNQKLKFEPDHYDKCRAGYNYAMLTPNGDVYRCYSGFVQDKYYMGNIIKGTFRFHKKPQPCNIGCYFPCDLELQ